MVPWLGSKLDVVEIFEEHDGEEDDMALLKSTLTTNGDGGSA